MLKSTRKPFRIASMAVKHVEIDKIGKDQTTGRLLQCVNSLIDRLGIVLRAEILRHSQRIVNRSNLPDTHHVEAFICQDWKKVFAGRGNGIVVSILSAVKRSWLTEKRSGNDAANFVLAIKHSSRRFTDLVKLRQRHYLLMRSNLKYRISRSIDNWLAGPDVFLAQLQDDFRA